MLLKNYLLFAIIVILLIIFAFVIRLYLSKSKFKRAKCLQSDFYNWIKNTSHKRPNNEEFNSLYKEQYGNQHYSILVNNVNDNYNLRGVKVIEQNRVDVNTSFPSMISSVCEAQFNILDNMVDHYEYIYKTNFLISFWIEKLIFLPQTIITYSGVEKAAKIKKSTNILYWFAPTIWTLIKMYLLK